MNKCDNCVVFTCSMESMARTAEIGVCIAYKPKEPKQTYFDKFRQDTATIDGLNEWLSGFDSVCRLCAYDDDDVTKCTTLICEQGIRAYFERTVTNNE